MKGLDKINIDLEHLIGEKQTLLDSLIPLVFQLERTQENEFGYNINGRKYAVKRAAFEATHFMGAFCRDKYVRFNPY
ncbi:hypothetical protein D3C86_1699260 [compost metagenome]